MTSFQPVRLLIERTTASGAKGMYIFSLANIVKVKFAAFASVEERSRLCTGAKQSILTEWSVRFGVVRASVFMLCRAE